MCGVVDGGIVAGLWGYEDGQSGVGDIFAWYVRQGVPASVPAAAEVMGRIQRNVYRSDPGTSWAYDALHAEYTRLHDHFGRENKVMHRLREIRARALEKGGAG